MPDLPTMGILFRTDASLEIGSGHVMRCITLADELRQRGFETFFVCRDHPGHLCELIAKRGHPVHMLPACPQVRRLDLHDRPYHLAWLGEDWEKDAEQTATLARFHDVDLIVVDHYALDIRWENRLRPFCKRILVIDDLADRDHDCDFLLDQNLVADLHGRYLSRVSLECVQMLGPRYALLQPQYAKIRHRLPHREGKVKRVFIYFGGADSSNLTGMAIAACQALPCQIDVVVNSKSRYISAWREQVQGCAQIDLHEDPHSLADLMAKADLAIGAGGVTSWERCSLGLPSLVITLAENQKPIAEEMDRQGFVRWLGHKSEVTEFDLRRVVKLLFATGLDAAWSAQCMRLVDGLGAPRVCGLLNLQQADDLSARPATRRDERIFLETIGATSESQAANWFRQSLRDLDDSRIFVLEAREGAPIGWGLFCLVRDNWELAVHVSPIVTRSGLHSAVLVSLFMQMRSDTCGLIRFKPGWSTELPNWLKLAVPNAYERVNALSITICSDERSWINGYIPKLILSMLAEGHDVSWVHAAEEAPGGDLCFYLSYSRISNHIVRSRYAHNLVVHESALPKGRGWAPMTWQILEGESDIPVTLIEATDDVDAGPIYLQEIIRLTGSELNNDWRALQAESTLRLCQQFVENYPAVLSQARAQIGDVSVYPRRRAADSRLDSDKSISSQFDLLRIVNNDHYPAFFKFNDETFILRIEKVKLV